MINALVLVTVAVLAVTATAAIILLGPKRQRIGEALLLVLAVWVLMFAIWSAVTRLVARTPEPEGRGLRGPRWAGAMMPLWAGDAS